MPVLTIREIYLTARAAGFGEREAITWTALALAQSGGRTDAVSPRGTRAIGLWQIDPARYPQAGQWGDLADPRNSARAAFEISQGGTDLSAWTAPGGAGRPDDYRSHLPEVEQLIGISADPRGVRGYPPPPSTANGATPAYGSTPTSYDQIDPGQGLGTKAALWTETGAPRVSQAQPGDADSDGLSDVFERLVGTDPGRADSDSDGLADGFEAYVSGTDPLSIDTDHDGTTDGFEVAQRADPLSQGTSGVATPRWTIGAGYQRHLAAAQAQLATQQTPPSQPAQPAEPAPAVGPAPDLNGGRVSRDGAEPKLVVSLDAAGHGNWQGAVKSGNNWFLAQAGAGDKMQIFHRLDSNGRALDQMTVVGAAHATSFAVIGNTVYATHDGEVVTFPYQPGATIDGSESTPTGWKGYISIDPTQRFAVLRRGNHYRAYDLETREPIGKEVITPRGPRQGFSIVGDTLYVLTGKTNQPGRVDSFSFTTGQQTGTQDITAVGPGRHREPEGMFGDLMGVKTGLGAARRLKIYQLDTGVPPATAFAPGAGASAARVEDSHPENDDGDHVRFGGETVDRRTAEMLAEAERLANLEDPSIGKFKLTQGSFSHSVGASAGTHDGPGAFDMLSQGYSGSQKKAIGLALREVGFASWLRKESQGPWDEHWHGIAIGTKGLPSVAEGQVKSYLSGRNGLRGNAEDTDPRPDQLLTWEEYRQAQGVLGENPETSTAPVAPAVTPAAGGFDIASGQRLDPEMDSDTDGLTDAFEQLARLDPARADSDGDGLLDGYEMGSSATDPLLIDSDLDGFTDAAELRFGTDPLGLGGPGSGSSASPVLGGDVGRPSPLPDPAAPSPASPDPVPAGYDVLDP